jgi:hypothetical protein
MIKKILRDKRELAGTRISLVEVMLRINDYEGTSVPSLLVLFHAVNVHLSDEEIFYKFINVLCGLFDRKQSHCALFVTELSRPIETTTTDPTPLHLLCRDAEGQLSPKRAGILIDRFIWTVGYEYGFHNSGEDRGDIPQLNLHKYDCLSALFNCMCTEFEDQWITPMQLAFLEGSWLLKRPKQDQRQFLAQMASFFLSISTEKTLDFLLRKDHGISIAKRKFIRRTSILEYLRPLKFRTSFAKRLEDRLSELSKSGDSAREKTLLRRGLEELAKEENFFERNWKILLILAIAACIIVGTIFLLLFLL